MAAMNLDLKVIKNHRHKSCPICLEDHPFTARILVQLEIDICNECFYLRKESFFYLRDHVDQLRIGDLRTLGLIPIAQN